MKLKKFFAGVLAAAMMLTVVATAAFATTPEYTTTPDNVDLGIMKNYKVEKGTAPKEDFTFSVTYVPDKSKPYTSTYTYTETKTVKFEENMTAKDVAYTGSLGIKISDFSLPEGPGKYCFEIKETSNGTPGVTYGNSTRYLVITVANNDNLNGYVYYAQLYDSNYSPATSIKGQATGTKVDGANAFTNTYTANNVVISKDIKGGLGDLAAKFNFKVKLTVADTKNANQYVGAKVVHSDDTAVTVGTVWSISAKDSEDGWYDVKLGRNDQLELENLPEGVIVTVKETDGNEYTVSQNPSDISSKNANTSYAKIGTFTENTATVNATVGAVNGSIGFVNTKEGTPDMGVVLDNAPYIAMLAIVAIGGVALMLNKRRRDEE
ncbi:MAG: Spy0128 family protein [Faecalibacterium sp.]